MRPSVQLVLKLPYTPIIQRYALIKIWHFIQQVQRLEDSAGYYL